MSVATLAKLLISPVWQSFFFCEDDYSLNIIPAALVGLGRCGREETKGMRRRKTLTPDGECDVPLKVSVGEGGDVAGVPALVRLLCAGDEQSGVLCGAPALKPHPA